MRKKFSKKKVLILSVSVVVVFLAILVIGRRSADSSNEQEPSTSQSSSNPYKTIEADVRDPIIIEGVANAENSQKIYFDPSMGELDAIKVSDEQEVKAGDPLLVYKNTSVETQINEVQKSQTQIGQEISSIEKQIANTESQKATAQKSLDHAQGSLDKELSKSNPSDVVIEQLQQDISTYASQVQELDSEISSLNDSLTAMNTELSNSNTEEAELNESMYTTVTAPFDGVVYVDEKGKTDPAVPIIEIYSPVTVINATISEYDFFKIDEGQKVDITVSGTQEKMKGTITNISNNPTTVGSGEDGSGGTSFSVEISPEKPIIHGLTVQVSVPQNDLVLPITAVFTEEEQQYVYIDNNGVAEKKPVEAFAQGGVQVITSGVEQGEMVVSNPDENLQDGDSLGGE